MNKQTDNRQKKTQNYWQILIYIHTYAHTSTSS